MGSLTGDRELKEVPICLAQPETASELYDYIKSCLALKPHTLSLGNLASDVPIFTSAK